jgi:HAE1 family hydrophobic/amphiphilic exporter-1
MASFAFVMGVLPMARVTGAGAYSRNSLGIVIAAGMLVSTVLGRFVIPIDYIQGERRLELFSPTRARAEATVTEAFPQPPLKQTDKE